jgi:hypothetical protein
MTKTIKIAASVMVAGAVALSILPQSAQATQITGTVAFSGGVTGYENTTGTGTSSSDFTLDHSLVFNNIIVNASPAPTGNYAGTTGDAVTIAGNSPLLFNPTQTPPVPSPIPLWSINGTALTFVATTLNQTISTPLGSSLPNSSLNLFGIGTLFDGVAGDAVTGTWNANFSSSVGGVGAVTFSFESTAGATPTVPDNGTSLIFLGLSLAGLGAFARTRKQVA